MKNPFAIKSNKDGVYEYDKRTTSFAGKYAKAILDKMPKELRNEDVYNDIINTFVFSSSLSKSSPLYEVIQLTNQGDVAGLNKILSDISSGNNTKHLDYQINSWNEFGNNRKDNIKKASDFPAITEIQYPYPRSSEKSKKEIDAENFYQTNPKSRFAGITGEEINPNNYGTARSASGAITNPSKGLTPFQTPRGFESNLFDNPGITVDSETQNRINFNQQRISDIQKLSEGIRNQIDSGIGTDGKKLNNKELESLRLQLKENDEALINSRSELRPAGQSMPLGVSQSLGVNQFPQSQQQTPPAQSVIPPANPQGQVEFMQQQAQQMPVPNEVLSRTQLPPMASNMPEAEQQVGMQEEMPQDNGSIFQRLRNLFSGKQPQSPQPSVAPQVTPQTTQQQPVDNRIMGGGAGDGSAMGQTTMPINTPIDNRVMGGGAGGGSAMNEMMPKEFQNAQNLGQQVTQPGMFGGGKGDSGSMGQSATTGLSGAFANAGESPIGTTGAVAGTTNVNTGALPQNVVDNATQTQTTIPTETGTQPTGQVAGQGTQAGAQTGAQAGTGTKPPPLATPGIVGGGNTFSPQFIAGGGSGGGLDVRVLPGQVVTTTDEKGQKSKSIQDLIEIGGTGFDDEVLARKLRRQAAMPDLKNEDYYPNQPFTQAQTAWGDPIFSGAGALFPMAAYDAQRKARAQAELDEAKRDVMQIKIPEIKTGAYVGRFRTDYIDAVTGLTDEYVKKYGSSQKAIRAMKQDGSLAKLQSQYEGVARSIDQTADRAKEFLKNAQEKSTTMYFSPEGFRAATNFMNGMGAYADGLISAEQLNQLEQQFNTAERWDNYKERNMKLLTADERIPTAEQMNALPSQEDDFAFRQVQPNGTPADFQTWLFVKKYTELNKDKVLQGIVLPFISQNPLAMEQLANPNETPDQTANRIAESIVALRGQEIEVGQRDYNPSGRNTTIVNFNPTGGEKGIGFHESTLLSEAQIRENLNKNRQNKSLTNEQLVDQSFGGSWRARPNDPYVRASVPGQIYDASTTPLRYSDYLQPTGISGQGSPDRQWNTIDQKDLDTIGAKSTSETPKFAKIVGVEMSWAVRDPKTKQWNMVTADNLKKYGMPPNAKMVIIEQNLLYNEPGEEVSTTFESPDGSKMTTPAGTEKGPRKAIKAVRVLEATPQNVRFYDDITNPTRSNEGAYGVPKSGTATTPSTGQNISLK
jgi:hypothetical protein